MITPATQEQHVLSCRNLSLFSTINGSTGCSRILAPPPVAQFIKEISFKAYSGEVYGVIGAPGSGKSTLLEAISCRGSGDVTGSLQLNFNILSRERFASLGSFVSSETAFPVLSVRSLIYYTARLHLGGLTTIPDIHRRVKRLMSEFEILQYAQKRPSQLSESARRRLLVALAIVKDPLVVVVDDILHGLDSLSSFHVLTCLSVFAKKNNRIVVVSLKSPRSDLYQLLDRVTILFYGEAFYSGRTKDLPGYFRDAGFPCPSAENPAMYYLTLSTIDREAPARFTETQEQAVSLVAKFKETNRQPPTEDIHINRQSYGIGSSVALCYLERPSLFRKFLVLVRRNCEIIGSSPLPALLSLFLSPLLSLFVSFFAGDLPSGGRSVPHSVNGLFALFLFLHSAVAIFTVNFLYSPLLPLSYREYWESIANQSVHLMAFLVLALPLLAFSSFFSSLLLFWRVNLLSLMETATFGTLLLSSGLISQALVLVLMLFFPDDYLAVSLSLSSLVILFSFSGNFLRSIPSLASSWLDLFMVVNPYTYTGHLLSLSLVSPLKTNCTRPGRLDVDPSPPHSFCRWKSGLEAHQERYPGGFQSNSSVLYLSLIVLFLYFLVFLLHFVRKPVILIKRFL